jgi:hypothetical protein
MLNSRFALLGWAEANVMIGFFFFYWFLTPVLYVRPAPSMTGHSNIELTPSARGIVLQRLAQPVHAVSISYYSYHYHNAQSV